jgi:hypothetical protein
MTIPVTSSSVDLSLLHPVFKKRLEAFFSDARIAGRVSVVSGCRSYAKQQYFYKKYKSGRGNLAANPDRRFGKNNFWRGSWHMQQDDGYCYAVDFRIVGSGISTWEVQGVAKEYGVLPTVKSEWWHHQPRSSEGWFDAPALSEGKDETKEIKVDLKSIAKYLDDIKKQLPSTPIRYRERSERVRVSQRRLGEVGHDSGLPDGIFGRKTVKAVKAFQRAERIARDGVIGPMTWTKMWS